MSDAFELFNRAARVVIHELEITGLDVDFRVERTLTPEPDRLELTIYNLNEQHRAQLQEQKVVSVTLQAGYTSQVAIDEQGRDKLIDLPQIFSGELREVKSKPAKTGQQPEVHQAVVMQQREGPTWLTVLHSADGEEAKKQRATISFGRGALLSFAIQQVAATLGLGVGTLPSEVRSAKLFERGGKLAGGIVLNGKGFDQLTRLMTAARLEWCVQDGCVVMMPEGKTIEAETILLTPETGLVGSPQPASDGRVQARALLQAEIVPGRKVRIESRYVKAEYRIENVAFIGETSGGPWYADIEGKAL